MRVEVKMPTDAELDRMFNAIPILERHSVGDKTVRAGAAVVVKRAQQLAPRGKPEDKRKRSKSQRQSADWDYPLWKTIKQVVRKYSSDRVAIIGPEWPKGNKAYFNTSPRGRRQVFWGTPTGRTVPQIRNWIVQAFDETRPQQLAAMKAKLQQLMREIWE